MYSSLLVLHSILRWLILIAIIYVIITSFSGMSSGRKYSVIDKKARTYTTIFVHLQLLIGLILTFVSPLVQQFFQDVGGSMSNSELRFFGMEHTLVMLIAVVLITVGSAKAKRKTEDKTKFKTLAIWFSIALLLILFSIPWSLIPFNPDRPFFRF